MNMMEYKGYIARIDYDDEDEIFVGRLLGLRAVVSFHADTVAKLKREMQLAVDEYVASCEKRGETPEKPMSGQFALRMRPEIHGRAAILAEASGKSLNQFITDVLEDLVKAVTSDKFADALSSQKKVLADVGRSTRRASGQFVEVRATGKKSTAGVMSKQRVAPRG
ncbi:MAG TPA: type II toxin-antitoxin system HicB family antitoxin [Caldimonas sp.]|nr:type II toxin-antitoxin system HicB family antitoxin [Caldimonas sp.]